MNESICLCNESIWSSDVLIASTDWWLFLENDIQEILDSLSAISSDLGAPTLENDVFDDIESIVTFFK